MATANATRAFLGPESDWAGAVMMLDDVQPLWGGRRIRVVGVGSATLSVVARGLRERRFLFVLEAAVTRALLDAFIAADFVTLRPPERPGIPDEGRPTLTLMNACGERRTISKWAGVQDPGFATVYTALARLESLTTAMTPAFEGRFEFGPP